MTPFRLWTAVSLVLLVPAGFASRRVYNPLGGLFYEIFWCLAAGFVMPRRSAAGIASVVLAATCALEFLQLWHPPVLEWARGTFTGRTILGSYFDWSDFPYYFLGSAAGFLCLRALRRAS